MSKTKTVWHCQECGHKEHKWVGQCTQCKAWNSFHEELVSSPKEQRFRAQTTHKSKPMRVREVNTEDTPRHLTHVKEFDRLIGGGIVPGSLSLVGGDPGIGKSTLLLQVANVLARQGLVVLYVCGEESVEQTTLRARRLGVDSDNLLLLSETNFSTIAKHVDDVNPDAMIIDSIQIVYKSEVPSAPGSVTQVRETTTEFMHLAKTRNMAIFLVGHVTKAGELAGPRVLEHLVDTVLYFEGDKQHNYRMLRVVKNRFGPTDEIAVFQMQQNGLAEVSNPSQIFLEERQEGSAGSAIIPTVEGSRPILIEAQALVTESVYSTPSRRCAGLNQNRLGLLLAVLEKRSGYPIHRCDAFVSIAGGFHIMEPAADLGVVLAVASSFLSKSLPPHTVVVGEVGLGGEIRSVPRIDTRIKEAVRMGFARCICPQRNVKGIQKDTAGAIEIRGVNYVEEAIHALLG